MDRDALIAEIKKQLLEELKASTFSLEEQIPDSVKKQAQEYRQITTDFVQKNPLAAVGLAALAGFVLARWIYHREDR